MIKRFILNWIRNHMSHAHWEERNEILAAINEGCRTYFYEDTHPSRISWIVGELVKNDETYTKENAPIVLNAVTHEMLEVTNDKMQDLRRYNTNRKLK